MRWYALLVVAVLVLISPLAAQSRSRLLSETSYYRLHCYPVNDAIARQIAGPLTRRIEKLHLNLGVQTSDAVDIFILPDRQTYRLKTVGKGKIVEFSEAFYSRVERRIYVRSPDQINDDYLQILIHEYIHWLLDTIFLDAPLWFHEGMATYFSGQFGFDKHVTFLQMRFWGRYLKLNDMQRFYPANQSDWQLFYLTSSLSIHYIMSKRLDEWNRLWDIVAWAREDGRLLRFHRVFQDAFGQSVGSFALSYDRFARSLAFQYIFYGVNVLIFTLMPLIIVIGWLKRRRRMKRLPDPPIEALIDEEVLEDDTDNHEGRYEP